ncbi:MAG: glycosyl transferase [Minisyncoccia bacterium]
MIITEFYKGQGLGNQLACYVATRVIAKDLGYDFGIMHPEKFKGADFLNLDYGKRVIGGSGPEGGPPTKLPEGIEYYYQEKEINHPVNGSDIRLYDKDLVSVYPNTKIDGMMQDEKYFEHRKNEIKEWLKVKTEYECNDYANDNTCVINFRGGEYARHKDIYLSKKYWEDAVNNMLQVNQNFKFVVITDDTFEAKKFFPNYDVFHFSIAKDYVVIKNAHYLILSNSSFAWFPAWLSENLKYCIAPKYWARHNVSDGYWSCGYNITANWMYQDRNGKLSDYPMCLKEFNEYKTSHKNYFLSSHDKENIYLLKSYKTNRNIPRLLYKKISRLIPNRIKNFLSQN